MEAETLTNVLPNEVLLGIFRFLEHKDLIRAEQVCRRWKTTVETYFATEKRLNLSFSTENYSYALKLMNRYGSSLKTLKFEVHDKYGCAKLNWAEEIAVRFPNLITIQLCYIRISDYDFMYLSTNCSRLNNVTLHACSFSDEGFRMFLQALPGIEVLNIYKFYYPPELIAEEDMLPQALAVFSTCRSLHTFEVSCPFGWNDTDSFLRFCKECVTLRTLRIRLSHMPAEMFAQIQHCSLLEELRLYRCPNVDDSTLSLICHGCPNLRSATLLNLPLTSDVGLKCFAKCRYLNLFRTDNKKMTYETLVELSKCVNLRKVDLRRCPLVGNRGCAALLAHCPLLEVLGVRGCRKVSDATAESAIEAVERRHNGLVLRLRITGSNITRDKYVKCHPLLRCLRNKW